VTHTKAGGWAYTDEAPLVKELFRRFLQGEYNLAEIARAIGIPRTNVRFILSNPIYTGWRVYDHRHRKNEGRNGIWKKVPRRPEDIIRVRLPLDPIVSEEQFARVQQLLISRPQHRPRRSNTDIFLYRGLLGCECGSSVYTTSNSLGRHFYCCRTWIATRAPSDKARCDNGYMTTHRLEELLDDAVSRGLTDVDVLEAAIGSYLEQQRGGEEPPLDQAGLSDRLEQLQKKRARILETFFEGLIAKAERDRRLAQLDDQVATTRRLIDRVGPKQRGSSYDQVINSLVSTFAEWRFVDREGRRRILEALSPTFTVRKYGVDGVRFPLGLLDSSPDSGSHWKTADDVAIANRWRRAGGLYVPLSA
jgi:hypothetical protein